MKNRIIISTILFVIGILLDSMIFMIASYLIIGYEVLIESFKNIIKGELFDENFLMTIASLGAFLIGSVVEGTTVMLLFQIGEFLQEKAISKSRKSISDLMELKSDCARIGNDFVPLEEVHIGDLMVVQAGEKIPLDGTVVEGKANIDTKALTGEAKPLFVEKGSSILSGCFNLDGVITVKVDKLVEDSTVTRILKLIEQESDKKTKTEKFMTRFSRVYTPIVVILAFLIALIPSLITGDYHTWIYRSIVFLVLSCPCALVISIPLGFFYGIGRCSKIGMLVKGSTELEMLSKIKSMAFDKTGTLTEGVFEVTQIELEKKKFLDYVCSLEKKSNHPITSALLKLDFQAFPVSEVVEYAGMGIEGKVKEKEVLIGNQKLFHKKNIVVEKVDYIGTILYVAVDQQYVGYIVISDRLKEDTKKAIGELKQYIGYSAVISGDKKETVESIKNELQLDECYFELLPDGKVNVMKEMIQKQQRPLAFVGDGMNDAPVLALSDLGISMGGIGSDAAIEASDIVIMNDHLSLIPEGIKIARQSIFVIRLNIVLALFTKIVVLLLGIFGISSIWFAIFADVGVTLLAIFNTLILRK